MAVDDIGRLSISVTQADGSVIQWNPDDVDGKNIPNDLTFSTKIPGGFDTLSCSLLRRIDQDYPDQDLFDDVTVYGAGNRIAWQGRMEQFPRSHGAGYSITPGAVGWSAHLRDNPAYSEVFIDRDLSRYRGMTQDRAYSLSSTSFFARISNWEAVTSGTDHPGIITYHSGPWPANAIVEVMYDAGPGNLISGFRGQQYVNGGISRADAQWALSVALSTTADVGTLIGATDVRVYTDAQAFNVTGGNTRYAILRHYYGIAYAGSGEYRFLWYNLRAIGPYATITGSTPETEGNTATYAMYYMILHGAPLLNAYGVERGGEMEYTDFPIPQLAFNEKTTVEQAIMTANAYHLWDWGVYDNRTFFYRQPDPDRLTWEARLGDGAYMDADGLTGEQVVNGVFVYYTDPNGEAKTAGPVGSGADTESASLQDTSATNPVNSHGIPAKWTTLNMSVMTTSDGAIQIGAAYLAERALATRRGSMTLTGTVQHPTEGKVPVWRIRAGDWIRVADLNGENADVPRKIIGTSYSHASRSISLQLDNTVAKLDAILARVGVQAGVMTGGGF